VETAPENLGDRFPRDIIVSIVVHLGLVLFFVLQTALTPSTDIQIRNAIRVDVVGLPDKAKPEKLSPPKSKTTPKVELPKKAKKNKKDKAKTPKKKKKVEVPKKKSELKNLKSEQNSALHKLKAQEAIEKLRQQAKSKDLPQETLIKGNAINQGSSLEGLDKLKFDDYFQTLQEHLRNHWDLPQWLANANLKAQAIILLDKRGYVIKKELVSSSMNEVFDAKVLQTIDDASPCPKPPPRLANLLESQGIILNFP
jgi:colicin import membrane protein